MPWPVHPTGFLGARGDSDTYRIERSLRFNDNDSAYLSRTFGSPTDGKKATFSLWYKRASLGGSLSSYGGCIFSSSTQNFISVGGNAASGSDEIELWYGNAVLVRSNGKFRDPSAWYHLVIVLDSTQATASNRCRIYLNGSEITSWATDSRTNITQNSNLNYTANGSNCLISGYSLVSNYGYFDGYLAEYHLIDGQALSPSSFGETDAITGRWKAKAYSGTYGNNGFYLSFKDNTSTTTLGYDDAGSNDWTLNNFSVTAGAGNDSLVDSPTNYGTDTGVGGEVRGNYCTLNPIDKGSSTLANGNLDWSSSASYLCRATFQIPSTGKWYWEFQRTSANGTCVGIATQSASLASFLGSDSFGWGYVSTGNKLTNDATGTGTAYGASYTTTDIIGISFDSGAGTLVFYKNGVSQGTAYSGLTGSSYFPAVGSNTASGSFNFGQRPFAYTAPSGFKALCTQNLPQPTIQKPSKYMDALAYTGTGASNAISSLGFSPDLVWIKNRGTTTDHALYDTTRGTQAQISSNSTAAEVTSSSGLTAFDSAGFTIGTSSLVNTNGTQYVAWSWDESAKSGLDIVGYVGDGSAGKTISHNLGVAPKMIIVKNRTTGGFDWVVYHQNMNASPQGGYLGLNATYAFQSNTTIWNNTAPSSSVFTLGTNTAVNKSGDNHIAYCFAEIEGYSKFGSYTGNGSADGPFVWCGFRPKYLLIKDSTNINNWEVLDTSRDTFNVTGNYILVNSSQAEATVGVIDILSNGFKNRYAGGIANTNGATVIFAAFAESPFKYARAR